MNLNSTPAPPELPTILDSFDDLCMSYVGRVLPMGSTPSSSVSDILASYLSCGVSTLKGLSHSTPEQIVYKILRERAPTDYKKIREAFVVFSDTSKGPGNRLYAYIKEKNLGNIVEFGPRKNPNTGNLIKLWVWEPPHASLDVEDRMMPIWSKDSRDKTDTRFSAAGREA